MSRVTRSSQKQIEFRCRKTRSQQKEIEGTIETSRGKQPQACSISPRKRREPAKGKLKTFVLLYFNSFILNKKKLCKLSKDFRFLYYKNRQTFLNWNLQRPFNPLQPFIISRAILKLRHVEQYRENFEIVDGR